MPPDYSGQNLRGRSFKGHNLEGANFSYADIRGVNFTDANLQEANFTGAKAGLQKRWVLFLVLLSWLMWGISAFLQLLSGLLLSSLISKPYTFDSLTVVLPHLIATIIVYIIIIRQGTGKSLVGFGASFFALVVIWIVATTFPSLNELVFAFVFVIVSFVGFAFFLPLVGILFGIFGLAGTLTSAGTITGVFTAVLVFTLSILFTIGAVLGKAGSVPEAIGIISCLNEVIMIYASWQAIKEDEKFSVVRNTAVAFAAIGGTSFHGADLTDANFKKAKLKSTDLRKAKLIRTCFHKTKLLDRVRPGTSYLQHSQIRKLIYTGQGQNKIFDRQDLRGINLKEANLVGASFIDTDLSQANLQEANLFEAKLVQTNLDQANLSNVCLTGAYIEDWGITRKTNLDNVKCKYVYLKLPTEGDRDPNRMPPSEQGEFGEYDFNIFITSVLDTLDLYHKDNINAGLAITILKGLTEEYPVQFELVGLEKRGDNQFIIRLKVFGQTSHFQLQREYYARYEQTLPLYDPKKLMPSTDVVVEEIVQTVKENPGTHIENLHNQGIFITGGSLNRSNDRIIHTGGSNYNECIEGYYTQIKEVGNMTSNQGGFSVGGDIGGSVNNVQGDNNRAVQGDNNQGVLGDNNQVTQQNQVGTDTQTPLTKEEVIELLAELEALVKGAELPAETKEEVVEDLSSAKKATDREEPNQNRALDRLGSVAETLEKTSKTVESGQKLWSKAKPIIVKVASWLGAAAGSHLLGL